MSSGLFSTYKAGENRITATIIAVLQRLSIERLERLLGAIMSQSELSLISFNNQPSSGAEGIPDAEIVSSCRILIETKITRSPIEIEQLNRHLVRLKSSSETNRYLILLTPHDQNPISASLIEDKMLIWSSFAQFNDAIDELLEDKQEVISERETLLLRELQMMFNEDNLIKSAKDTVVVAARVAWDEYHKYNAYICQPNRSFDRVKYLAFYQGGVIQPTIPLIEGLPQEVVFVRNRYEGKLGIIVNKMIDDNARTEGAISLIFQLSEPNSLDTIVLEAPIQNNQRSSSGKHTAFTMGQRYVNSSELRRVAKLPDDQRFTSNLKS